MEAVTCLGAERLAAAAAGEDGEATAHALLCPACRAALDEQRALRRLAGGLAGPPLPAQTRDRLAAGVMARLPAVQSRRWPVRVTRTVGIAAAAIALCVFGLWAGDRASRRADDGASRQLVASGAAAPEGSSPSNVPGGPAAGSAGSAVAAPVGPVEARLAGPGGKDGPEYGPIPLPGASDPAAGRAETPAGAGPRAPVAAAVVTSRRAQFGRAMRGDRDIVELRDGEVTVDARNTAPIELRLGDTAVRVADAKATVTAKTGAIASVVVFAGSVELSSGASSTVVIAGTTWEAPRTDPSWSLAAFRSGWSALRRNELAAAVTAFDKATDPVVREEAAFWAAVAVHRSGDHAAARRRFRDFLVQFPDSSRSDAAREALAAEPASGSPGK